MGKASMTDAEPPENDNILTTDTTQITVAEERFDKSVICLGHIRPTRPTRDADSD